MSIIDTGRPCELMEFDWAKNDSPFCINTRKCKLQTIDTKEDELCFGFYTGEQCLVYVNTSRADPSLIPRKVARVWTDDASLL